MSYFTEHPELLDGLPEHWKSFSDKPWFPYVVGALTRPDERMRKQLLAELGQPDMPKRVWQFAISSFMLVLTYKWPPVTMSGTEDAWRLFRQHLVETYEDDLYPEHESHEYFRFGQFGRFVFVKPNNRL